MEKRVLVLILLVFCLGGVLAGEYYVSPSGSASWSGCKSSSGPYCSLDVANKNAVAGDVVILREGIYEDRISPLNSGTKNNYITFQKYSQDPKWSVVIRGLYAASDCDYRTGICLKSDYIKVKDVYVNMNKYGRWVEALGGSDYNIVDSCKFYNAQTYTGVLINSNAKYTKIINSEFPDAPISSGDCWSSQCNSLPYSDVGCKNELSLSDCSTCCWRETAPADIIRDDGIGTTIENNNIGKSSHQGIVGIGKNGIFRNNIVRNTYHSSITSDGVQYLIENNIIKDSGSTHLENPSYRDRAQKNGAGLYLMGTNTIARYNVVSNSDVGLNIGGKATSSSQSVRTYHNSYYDNSLQMTFGASNTHLYQDNVIKNSIFHNDENLVYSIVGGACYTVPGRPVMIINCADSPVKDIINYFVNNVFTPNDNTFYFKDTRTVAKSLSQVKAEYPIEWDSSNFESSPKWVNSQNGNFNLQADSNLINAAQFLTTIKSISSNKITVGDSLYFYDGFGIPGEVGDIIYNQNHVSAKIISIDYNNNVITLDSASGFSVGNQLTTVNFSGSAPDIGAYEFFSSGSDGLVIVEPYCGDGACDSLESCLSCSADCGECEVDVGRKSYFTKRLSGAVLIDGEVSEFRNANYVFLENSNGNFANCSFVYDSENLYVGCKVLDSQVNTFYTNRDENVYNDDSIEIVFDLGNEKSSSYDLNDYKIILSAGNVLLDSLGSSKSFNMNIESEVVLVSGGYVLEMSVPFPNLSRVVVNDSWGFDLKFNDLDSSGNIVTSMWSNLDGGSFNNPSGWGGVVFVEGEGRFCSSGADVNGDSFVSVSEIGDFIFMWREGSVSINELMKGVSEWRGGC